MASTKERPTLVILDNSTINNSADVVPARALRHFQRQLRRNGMVVAATSINLIEISRTPDRDRAQRILATLVGIAAKRPLADPETLIVQSIDEIVSGTTDPLSGDRL